MFVQTAFPLQIYRGLLRVNSALSYDKMLGRSMVDEQSYQFIRTSCRVPSLEVPLKREAITRWVPASHVLSRTAIDSNNLHANKSVKCTHVALCAVKSGLICISLNVIVVSIDEEVPA